MKIEKIRHISIIIPAYNEQNRILHTLRLLNEYSQENFESFEVIIVDDGSADRTNQLVSDFIKDKENFFLIHLTENSGKGRSIQKGVQAAKEQTICFMDADGSTDISCIRTLYQQLNESCDIVIGSRAMKESKILVHQNWFREKTGKLFNKWIQLWILPGISDTQCGFKLFKAPVAKKIFDQLIDLRFGFDMEILFKAKLLGFRIKEVPVTWSNVPGTTVSPIKDGIKMAIHVIKLRFLGQKLI